VTTMAGAHLFSPVAHSKPVNAFSTACVIVLWISYVARLNSQLGADFGENTAKYFKKLPTADSTSAQLFYPPLCPKFSRQG
jgi:hypothetical protein